MGPSPLQLVAGRPPKGHEGPWPQGGCPSRNAATRSPPTPWLLARREATMAAPIPATSACPTGRRRPSDSRRRGGLCNAARA